MALPENNIETGKILKDYNGPELRSTQLSSGSGDPVGNTQWNPTNLPLDSPSTSGSGDMRERKMYAPFTPRLTSPTTFIITDGFVVDMEGGITNVDCLNKYYPTGIGTIGGAREIIPISVGDYIYIKCEISPNGVCSTQTLVTDPANKLSFNPNPVDQDPTAPDNRTKGEFWFKIAQYVPEAGGVPPHLVMHLAGSHIYLRHRGGNLDLRVNVDSAHSDGSISHNSFHYLVFRHGLYIGFFDNDAVKPSHIGVLDEDTVTYLS